MTAAAMYDNAVRMFTLGELRWDADSIRVLLCDDRYEPDQGADQSRADLGISEVKPSGSYRSGGAPLLERAIEPAPGLVRLTGGNPEWDSFTGEYRYAVVYQANSEDDRSQDMLIAYTDLGLQRATEARVVVQFDPAGVCVFEAAAV